MLFSRASHECGAPFLHDAPMLGADLINAGTATVLEVLDTFKIRVLELIHDVVDNDPRLVEAEGSVRRTMGVQPMGSTIFPKSSIFKDRIARITASGWKPAWMNLIRRNLISERLKSAVAEIARKCSESGKEKAEAQLRRLSDLSCS